jgi:hypothetical protein
MADLLKVKNNVSKMVSQGAPEADIDNYISLEGVTVDEVRNFKVGAEQTPKPTFYSEAVAPILEGGSTFAAGIPRLVAKAQGPGMEKATFPEQQTVPGKILRGVSEVAGFTAGLPSRVALLAGRGVGKLTGKFLGKGILSRATQGAAAGAAGMATAGSDLEDRKRLAITGGILGGAAPVAFGAGRGILRGVGKGVDYLRKSTADYVTTKVAPRAYQFYQEAVNKFTPEIQKFAEEGLKISKSAVNTIKNKGIDTVSKVREFYNDSVDPIVQKIEQGFANKRELANSAYKQAMSNPPKNFGGTVDVRDTLKTMDNVFKGSLGEATRGTQGNRLYLIRQELKSRIPMPKGAGSVPATSTQLQRQLQGEKLTEIAGEVRLNVKQFSELRDALNSLYRENPYDRNIAKVMNSLYEDGERSGLVGLQKARALQRQAFEAEEALMKKGLINQNKLNNFQKLTEAERRQLKQIEQYTGESFVDDLDAITADRALDKLREYNPDRFANDLNKAIDPKWTEYVKKEYKGLLGNKADEIFNDIVAHRRGVKIKAGLGISGGLLAIGETGRRGYRLLTGGN